MSIEDTYMRLKERIPKNVQVLVACKYLSDAQITSLLQFPELVFGENYVQDAQKRTIKIARERYHFIGKLQRNKVRTAVKLFGTIQTVDSKKLAEKIAIVAREEKVTVTIYIQVNLEKDETHGGIGQEYLADFISYVKKLQNISLRGVMLLGKENENKVLFRKLRIIADQEQLKTSMGTSSDYTDAIKEKTDLIRLGRIFKE